MAEKIFEVGRRVEKRGKEGRLGIVKQFFRILRKLKFGTTIMELAEDEGMSRRTVHRWLVVIDGLFGLEKIVSDRHGGNWIYRINREKIREKF